MQTMQHSKQSRTYRTIVQPVKYFVREKDLEAMQNKLDEDIKYNKRTLGWQLRRESEKGIEHCKLVFKEFPAKNLLSITATMPGITKHDICIELKGDLLTLSNAFDEELWVEFDEADNSNKLFSRSIRLPKEIQPTDVVTKYNHGVLHLDVHLGGANWRPAQD